MSYNYYLVFHHHSKVGQAKAQLTKCAVMPAAKGNHLCVIYMVCGFLLLLLIHYEPAVSL